MVEVVVVVVVVVSCLGRQWCKFTTRTQWLEGANRQGPVQHWTKWRGQKMCWCKTQRCESNWNWKYIPKNQGSFFLVHIWKTHAFNTCATIQDIWSFVFFGGPFWYLSLKLTLGGPRMMSVSNDGCAIRSAHRFENPEPRKKRYVRRTMLNGNLLYLRCLSGN